MILQKKKKNAIHFDDLVKHILLKMFPFNSCFTLFHFNLRIYCLFFINYFWTIKRKSKKKKTVWIKFTFQCFEITTILNGYLFFEWLQFPDFIFCILILWSVQKYLGLKIIHFLALLIYIIVFQFGYLLFVLLVSYFIKFSFLTLNQKSRSK